MPKPKWKLSKASVVWARKQSSPDWHWSSACLWWALGIPLSFVDRKSTRLNSSHSQISYAVFCLKKKKNKNLRNSGSLINLTYSSTDVIAVLQPTIRYSVVDTCHVSTTRERSTSHTLRTLSEYS